MSGTITLVPSRQFSKHLAQEQSVQSDDWVFQVFVLGQKGIELEVRQHFAMFAVANSTWARTGKVEKTLASKSETEDELKFQHLLAKWHEECGATSSMTRMVLAPSYQAIIGMGQKAVPLILRQLETEWYDPDHWHWALCAITQENPVPKEFIGNTRKIAQAWIEWARERYVW
ncbi:MAG: hypothetical protein ACREFL_10845 [Stellaceae bacterium]